jgi:hypothetical protein
MRQSYEGEVQSSKFKVQSFKLREVAYGALASAGALVHSLAMRTCLLVLGAAVLTAATCHAQTPARAEDLLAKAKSQAAAEHKTIFVVFDASW